MPKSICNFKYEDKDFYNNYCSNLVDFTLLEYFEDIEKNNEFVGKIAPNNINNSIEIEVRIPYTFPHNKLLFVTWSLSGYPHLIPFDRNDSLKGNWFCLNSAFAETPKAQLDEEFSRLRGWFHKNLNESLPRHINDRNTQAALQIFNAYEGYNPDEINELAEKSQLTFVGDFAKHSENFKETSGYLNVVRYPNDKFTVFQDKEGTNEKLPYILVTHIPEHSDCFASWADEFKWDEKLCKTLLPDFRFREVSEVALRPLQKEGENKKSFFIRQFCGISDEEAEADQRFLTAKLSTMTMPRMHKEALQKEIDSIVESNRRMREAANRPIGDVDEIEEPDPQELYNNPVSKLHYFTIGIVCDGGIKWLLATANLYNRKYSEFHYNIERYRCDLKEVIDIKLWFSYSNTIGRKEYFGRGELNSSLADKRIAIIGLGAIGSPMAEALARGGVRQLTLWDGDIVEAGNICRSIYDNADIGNAKAQALAAHIKRISPFCDVRPKGCWYQPDYTCVCRYLWGDFYGNINYDSQKKFLEALHEYDLIIDCTASNELLHFLSYAANDVSLMSLCITNRATHLLCFSNHDGNPFELRKHFLASIEQDTENFYVEGTGCYSPTFLATSCDVQSLVNLCTRSIHRQMRERGYVLSAIWHYNDDNIIADSLHCYQLEGSPITMVVSESTINKMRQLPMAHNGNMGYLLGGYNTDRNAIFITSVISQDSSNEVMEKTRQLSNGIIDYVGNVCAASYNDNQPLESSKMQIVEIANNTDVDTNNPIVATVRSDGQIEFRLYINENFLSFNPMNNGTNGKI